MNKLSPHFSYRECTRSNTAIKHGIKNDPDSMQLTKMILLCENVLEPVRTHFGTPVKVGSMFRSKELNTIIGGARSSQHMKGEAADIDGTKGTTNKMILDYIATNLVFDQIIWEFGTAEEPDWVHVSYSHGDNRNQVIRAQKIDGKTVYTPLHYTPSDLVGGKGEK